MASPSIVSDEPSMKPGQMDKLIKRTCVAIVILKSPSVIPVREQERILDGLNAFKIIVQRDHFKTGDRSVARFSPVAPVRLPNARQFSRLGEPVWVPASFHAPLHARRLCIVGDYNHLVMSMRDQR
jgi:hypothetical protein